MSGDCENGPKARGDSLPPERVPSGPYFIEAGVTREVAWQPIEADVVALVSQVYELRGCAAVRLEAAVRGSGSGAVALQLEGTLDRMHWRIIDRFNVPTGGFVAPSAQRVASGYIRVRCSRSARNSCWLALTLTGMSPECPDQAAG